MIQQAQVEVPMVRVSDTSIEYGSALSAVDQQTLLPGDASAFIPKGLCERLLVDG